MNCDLGYFRHYKDKRSHGVVYRARIAKHTETGELFAVYSHVRFSQPIWIRPLDMFMGYVESEGEYVRRFKPCDIYGFPLDDTTQARG